MNRGVLSYLQSHHQVASLKELRSLGLTNSSLARLVVSGQLDQLAPRVYVLPGSLDSFERRCREVCAAWPSAVVSGPAAGRLWNLRRMGDRPVLVSIPQDERVDASQRFQVHRTLDLPAVDVIERPDGIRITAPARTAFDLGRYLDDDALASVVEQLLDRRLTSLDELRATNNRLARQGRAGSGRLTRVLDFRGDAQPLQSDLEHRFEAAIVAAGIAMPVRQHSIRLRNGQVIRFDFAWPELKLAIEIDGEHFHAGFDERRRDKSRDRRAQSEGWLIVRVQEHEVRFALRGVVIDLCRTIAERERQLRPQSG